MVNELEEFRKQYSETIIRMREKKGGSFLPVYVNAEGAQTENHICVNHSSFGQMQVHWKSKLYELNTDLPKRGLFNYKGCVGLFLRTPQRQSKRGLCHGTSLIRWITYDWRKQLNMATVISPSLGDLSFVNSLYDREYRHWGNVVDNLLDRHVVEEALSPQFALSQSPFLDDEDVLLLWYEDQVVGEFYPREPGIVVRQDVFEQEVQDFVKRKKIAWPVTFFKT
ncbi:MAG: hypothetical protein MN733_18570, partial [Nitrososphaera sp.]|nr:hypothetical protein [Nitrososphaera sp.]